MSQFLKDLLQAAGEILGGLVSLFLALLWGAIGAMLGSLLGLIAVPLGLIGAIAGFCIGAKAGWDFDE